MKIIHLQTGLCALILAVLGTAVNAATVDLTGTASVAPGDTFQLTIVGDFGTDGFIAGGTTLFWDDALVSLDNITLDLAVVPDFSCPGSAGCPPATANSAPVVWGEFLTDLIAPGAGLTQMATLTFTALPGPGGSAVFSQVDNQDLTGGWFGSGFAPIDTPTFGPHTVTINAVPVPAAVWLFGSGLLGLVGVARRRKAA